MADDSVGYGPPGPITVYLIPDYTLTYSVITGPLDGIDTPSKWFAAFCISAFCSMNFRTSHATLYKLYRLYKPDLSSRSRKLFIKEYTVLGIFKNIHYGRIPPRDGKNYKKNHHTPPLISSRALISKILACFFQSWNEALSLENRRNSRF
ncbi:hypothetical protein ACU8KH_00440 [Lachancea thermotolerans]